MRSNEERAAAVMRRIAEREQRQRRLRYRCIAVGAVVISLVLIVGVSAFLPGVVGSVNWNHSLEVSLAASIFTDNSVLGYIVIGMLAFILGVCVTLLCFRIRRFEQEKDDSQGEHDGQECGDGRAR